MSLSIQPAGELPPVETAPTAWKRWPCPKCGHKGRFAVVCPSCESLPWVGVAAGLDVPGAGMPGRKLRAGTVVEAHKAGVFHTHHRLTVPEGFLGVLTRRLSGGAAWLGVNGREWRIDRAGLLGQAWILRDGAIPVAAAESHGLWRPTHQVWQGERVFRLMGTGLTQRSFLLAVEDGPEVLRIHGGLFDPLHRIEVLSEATLATVVLTGFLVCGRRHGEGE